MNNSLEKVDIDTTLIYNINNLNQLKNFYNYIKDDFINVAKKIDDILKKDAHFKVSSSIVIQHKSYFEMQLKNFDEFNMEIFLIDKNNTHTYKYNKINNDLFLKLLKKVDEQIEHIKPTEKQDDKEKTLDDPLQAQTQEEQLRQEKERKEIEDAAARERQKKEIEDAAEREADDKKLEDIRKALHLDQEQRKKEIEEAAERDRQKKKAIEDAAEREDKARKAIEDKAREDKVKADLILQEIENKKIQTAIQNKEEFINNFNTLINEISSKINEFNTLIDPINYNINEKNVEQFKTMDYILNHIEKIIRLIETHQNNSINFQNFQNELMGMITIKDDFIMVINTDQVFNINILNNNLFNINNLFDINNKKKFLNVKALIVEKYAEKYYQDIHDTMLTQMDEYIKIKIDNINTTDHQINNINKSLNILNQIIKYIENIKKTQKDDHGKKFLIDNTNYNINYPMFLDIYIEYDKKTPHYYSSFRRKNTVDTKKNQNSVVIKYKDESTKDLNLNLNITNYESISNFEKTLLMINHSINTIKDEITNKIQQEQQQELEFLYHKNNIQLTKDQQAINKFISKILNGNISEYRMIKAEYDNEFFKKFEDNIKEFLKKAQSFQSKPKGKININFIDNDDIIEIQWNPLEEYSITIDGIYYYNNNKKIENVPIDTNNISKLIKEKTFMQTLKLKNNQDNDSNQNIIYKNIYDLFQIFEINFNNVQINDYIEDKTNDFYFEKTIQYDPEKIKNFLLNIKSIINNLIINDLKMLEDESKYYGSIIISLDLYNQDISLSVNPFDYYDFVFQLKDFYNKSIKKIDISEFIDNYEENIKNGIEIKKIALKIQEYQQKINSKIEIINSIKKSYKTLSSIKELPITFKDYDTILNIQNIINELNEINKFYKTIDQKNYRELLGKFIFTIKENAVSYDFSINIELHSDKKFSLDLSKSESIYSNIIQSISIDDFFMILDSKAKYQQIINRSVKKIVDKIIETKDLEHKYYYITKDLTKKISGDLKNTKIENNYYNLSEKISCYLKNTQKNKIFIIEIINQLKDIPIEYYEKLQGEIIIKIIDNNKIFISSYNESYTHKLKNYSCKFNDKNVDNNTITDILEEINKLSVNN